MDAGEGQRGRRAGGGERERKADERIAMLNHSARWRKNKDKPLQALANTDTLTHDTHTHKEEGEEDEPTHTLRQCISRSISSRRCRSRLGEG